MSETIHKTLSWSDPLLSIKLLGINVSRGQLEYINAFRGREFSVFSVPDFFGTSYSLDFVP
jgi:hypothetical protein